MGSEMKGLGALIGLKLVCCGGPLLAMAVASGAVAVVDVAAGVLAFLAAAGVGVLVVRGTARSKPSPTAQAAACDSCDTRSGDRGDHARAVAPARVRELV